VNIDELLRGELIITNLVINNLFFYIVPLLKEMESEDN